MPELIWKGKKPVINHYLEVPVRTLDRRPLEQEMEGLPSAITGGKA